MGFDWKKLIGVGVAVTGIALPQFGSAVEAVNEIINDPEKSNDEATKLNAALIDGLAKEVKKLRAEVDKLTKEKAVK